MDREEQKMIVKLIVAFVLAVALLYILIIPTNGFADILVKEGGGNGYASFTQAVYETVDSGETIVVFPGTYDIRKEYEELFGLEAVEEMLFDRDIGNDFQLGIILKNRKIIFMRGAKLTCVWDQPADEIHKFCPLYVFANVSLYGLDLYAEGMTYAIHDDVWMYDEPYINEYHYCKVVARRLTNGNVIGGGCGKYSRHILDHCYFDNGVEGSLTARYHNNTFPDSEGEIWITGCYFNSKLGICYMGDETNKIDVYVTDCVVEIELKHEVPEAAENMYLYEWNNK